MKKMLLAILLLSSVTFAQTTVQPPTCEDGKLVYQGQGHALMDLCITGLKAESPDDCYVLLEKLTVEGKAQKIIEDFFVKRSKEICGK